MALMTTTDYIIYDLFIEFNVLSEELMRSYGFNALDIRDVISRGIIRKTFDGDYKIANLDALEAYAIALRKEGYKEKADRCLVKLERLRAENSYISIKLKAVYDLIINGIPLNRKNFIGQGLKDDDIEALIKLEIIKKRTNDRFVLLWYSDLEKYAVELEEKCDFEKAELCRKNNKDTSKRIIDITTDLEIIFAIIASGETITESYLKPKGITGYRLRRLFYEGYIKKDFNTGIILPSSSNALYQYGKKLELQGQLGKAYRCYTACNEISFDEKILLNIFLYHIKNSDYKNALQILDTLRNSKKIFYHHLIKYYIFLLSFIIILPSEELAVAQSLRFEEILCNSLDSSLEESEKEQRFKKAIYNQKFNRALNQLSEEGGNDNSLLKEISIILLMNVIENQKRTRLAFDKAIQTRDIDMVLQILHHEESIHQLKKEYKVYSFIASDIKNIISIKRLPKTVSTDDTSILGLIQAHQYEKAYSEIIKNKPNNAEKSNLITLLVWVVELQKEYRASFEKISNKIREDNELINRLYEVIQSKNKDNVIAFIKAHIKTPLGMHFSYLIEAFIDYDLNFLGEGFIHIIGTFSKIIRNTFEIRISEYIKEANVLLENNQIVQAEMLILIIKRIINNGDSDEPEIYTRSKIVYLENQIAQLSFPNNMKSNQNGPII